MLETKLKTTSSTLAIAGPWPLVQEQFDDELQATRNASPQLKQRQETAQQACQDYLFGQENGLLAWAIQDWLAGNTEFGNPLVLCGQPGSGKSHLLWGIIRRLTSQLGAVACKESNSTVIGLTGQEFVTTLTQAQERDRLGEWQQRMRQARYLLIDDLTQLSGRTRALQELRFTCEELVSNGGQLLMTTRLSPELISGMTPALLSRFEAGQIVTIQPLGTASLAELWQRFATAQQIEISSDVAATLALHCKSNPVEIWHFLLEITPELGSTRQLTAAHAKHLLQSQRGTYRPNMKTMTNVAAKYFGLKSSDLLSPTRRRTVVTARNLVIYLARQLGEVSLEQLGKFFGGRDHTTVLHGYRSIEEKLLTDPNLRQAHDDLRKLLIQGLA